MEDTNDFEFTDRKMQVEFMHECHHWGAKKNVMEVNNKRNKTPITLRLVEKRQQIPKPGNSANKSAEKTPKKSPLTKLI